MSPITNKRRFQRYNCPLPIELRRAGLSYPLRSTTSGLSVCGSYATLTSALAIGTVVDIVLWTGDTKLTFRGTVRTADATGNGIEFTGMKDEDRSCLQSYLDKTNPPRVSGMLFR